MPDELRPSDAARLTVQWHRSVDSEAWEPVLHKREAPTRTLHVTQQHREGRPCHTARCGAVWCQVPDATGTQHVLTGDDAGHWLFAEWQATRPVTPSCA